MHPLSLARWEPRVLLLLLAAWSTLAEERQCSVDSECGYREECRKAVVRGVVAAVKTCQCHKYVFASGHEPACIAHNWRTVGATILMAILGSAFFAVLTQYRVAYREHMTDPPLRLGETRLKRAISLRTLFLAFSTFASISGQAFALSCTLTMYAPVSTHFWYQSPLSPIQLGSSLHAFGAASAFLVVVCIWIRVAAKLHDPAGSTKKALYQLAFALDGSGIGLYLAIFFALPTGAVVIYFLLKGSWDHAFQCGVLFVVCGLILTSLAAKLLVARRMHQYEMQKDGPRLITPKSWAFCDCLRRNRQRPQSAAAGPVEDASSQDPETGQATEEKDERAERERRTQASLAWRQSLQGDVVVSVSAESILSSVLRSSDRLSSIISSISEPVDSQEAQSRAEPPTARDERWPRGNADWRRSEETKETEKTGETDETQEQEGNRTAEPSRRTHSSSSSSQGQDLSGAAFIELRVRVIQWEAATLGKRVILTAAFGMVTFLLAMPYGPWRYSYMTQMVGLCLGGLGLVGANANCLCYVSPAVRRNVRRWRNGRNPLLRLIAFLLWRSHGG